MSLTEIDHAVGGRSPGEAAAAGSRPLISVVAPFFNEADVLDEFVRRCAAVADALTDRYEFEFVLVDDGSRDESLVVARRLAKDEPRLRVVELRRNYGQTAALMAGFDQADGEIIVSLDSDLQHFPEEIPSFLAKIEEGCDVVCGWRADRQEGVKRRWPSRVANLMIRRATRVDIHDVGTTFRAYRREIVRDMHLIGENHRFIPVFAEIAGAKIDELPIRNIERPQGESSYGLGRILSVLIDIVFLTFYTRYLDRPIRLFGLISLFTFVVGTVIIGALVYVFLETGRPVVRDHSGWFILSMLLMATSLQVLLAGMILEVVTRFFFSVRGQRPYRVRAVWRESGG